MILGTLRVSGSDHFMTSPKTLSTYSRSTVLQSSFRLTSDFDLTRVESARDEYLVIVTDSMY